MRRIAVLMTCHNRKEKTLRCLDCLRKSWEKEGDNITLSVFLTDDGCTDGTAEAIRSQEFRFPIHIFQEAGNLFWNGGMINSWKAALAEGGFDGYLWLNDDTYTLPEVWDDLRAADAFSLKTFGKRGIYVGSTKDAATSAFTYGGFNYVSKITLLDQFIPPDGKSFQPCQAAHGNITYISQEVVDKMGIFYAKYWHGGSDHDYTYRAHKNGFPVLVLPHYSAVCENDHVGTSTDFASLPLIERIRFAKTPRGFNLHNTLLYNHRCFPWRVPFVFLASIVKIVFPKFGYASYRKLRKRS